MGGGGKSPPTPTPEETPTPENEQEATSASVRDAAAKRLRAAKGHMGTIVTDPLGGAGAATYGMAKVLGRKA